MSWRGGVCLLVALLVGCGLAEEARKKAEVRRLQARSAYERGIKDLNDGRTAIGLAALEEAADLDPDRALYQNGLGVWYLRLGRQSEALRAFKRAVELDPNYGEAHDHLGVAYANAGKWEDAIKAHKTALSIPGYSDLEKTYHNLGWAYYNLGRLREAEESFRLVLQLNPKIASAYYHLGLVLVKAGRPEEAKLAFRRTRELSPDTPLARHAQEHLKALGEGG